MSQKRQEIIAVAASLMESKGYESTKLSDILEAAEIGKGQFYHYFSSKHELGLEVMDYFHSIFHREVLEGILSSARSADVKLNEMFCWILENHRSKQARCGCIFGNIALEMSEHDAAFGEKVRQVFDTWVQKLTIVLEEKQSLSGNGQEHAAEKTAQGIVAMLEGGIMMMKNKQDLNVLKDIIDFARHLIGTKERSCQ